MKNKTEQYPILTAHFDNKIAKTQSTMLGLMIGTPALVIIVMEILNKAL